MAYGICDFKMAASVSFGALNFGDKTSSNSDSLQDASTALGELDKGRLLEFMSIVLLVFLDLLSASKHNINKSSPHNITVSYCFYCNTFIHLSAKRN